MARRILVPVVLVFVFWSSGAAQDFIEQYSARAGLYASRKGLNNGFILGADASLDFSGLRMVVNLSGDCYIKQSFNIFRNPVPKIVKQQILLVPVSIGIGYRPVGNGQEGIVVTAGVAGGYHFNFYNVDYRDVQSVPARTRSDSRTGGGFFSALVIRIALRNFFVEPKAVFARPNEDVIGPYSYEIDPTGFLVTVGFQY